MNLKQRKAMTWALVAVGIAIVALGTTLALTMPGPGAFGGPRFGHGYWQDRDSGPGSTRDGSQATGPSAGDAPRYGRAWHRGMAVGPMHFGGILLVGGLVFVGLLIAGHGRRWPGRGDGSARGEDAVEILRREFAEGRLSEEEYRKRLATLKE